MVDFIHKERYGYEDLLEIMRLLRAPGGCPWDAEQTHGSILRNFHEETYEFCEAAEADDVPHMVEELGDVLMQVVFHAQMETEAGRFTMDDVCDGICKKMVYRHPHVFGSAHCETSAEVLETWDQVKRAEKAQETVSACFAEKQKQKLLNCLTINVSPLLTIREARVISSTASPSPKRSTKKTL